MKGGLLSITSLLLLAFVSVSAQSQVQEITRSQYDRATLLSRTFNTGGSRTTTVAQKLVGGKVVETATTIEDVRERKRHEITKTDDGKSVKISESVWDGMVVYTR